jgi:hypothetical protein
VWQPFEQHMNSPEHGESLVQRHWPLAQRLLLLPQLLPQLPQLLMSLDRSLQLPLQQDWPEAQTVPQLPQFALLLRVSTHAPLQQAWPLAQSLLLSQTQRPAWQMKFAGQATPHEPQFCRLVLRLVSQPLAALPSQFP